MTAEPESIDGELASIVHALRVAFRSSPDLTFALDPQGRFLMVNEILCQFLQLDEASLLGEPCDRSARSTDAERIRSSIATALAGEPTRYRATGNRLSGDPFVTEVTLVPLRLGDRIAAVVGVARDLTDTSAAETASRVSEDLLRLASRIARFGGWSIDTEHRRVQISEGARLMLELDAEDDDVTPAALAVHAPSDEPRFLELLERCLTLGEPFDVEGEMISVTGNQLWVRAVGEPERRSDGHIIGARGAILDMTAVRAAHARERALESRLSATLASIAEGIFFLDDHDRVTYANPRAVELARTSEAEFLGSPLWTLFPEAVAVGFRRSFERARSTGGRVVHRAYFPPFGRWFETTAYPTSDGLAVYLRDVSDEQAAAEEAQRAQEKLAYQAALLDTARDAMVVWDLDGLVLYWNRAAADLYGWSPEEAVGRNVLALISPQSRAYQAALDTVNRSGYFANEMEHTTRDGRVLTVDCRWQMLFDDQNRPTALFAINSDITEYRRELDARQRAQRLESLGTLAGGIAHDLNNVLTPILMAVQMLAADEQDAEHRELLSTVETAAKRGAEMIRRVLTFARGIDGRRMRIDIDRLLDDLLILTRDVMPRGVEVVVRREHPLPPVNADPTQLLQVLVNLVTNARDAMGDTGRLVISAETLDIDDEYTSVSHSAEAGRYLQLAVEDTGHGMGPDVIAKIFEPFYTTKSQGRGTGFGLATSLSIIRSHGGFMQVYSEVGVGTRFIVGLPVDHDAPEGVADGHAESSPLLEGNGELVLVVDDEDAIRTVTQRSLEAHGYRVLTATNGREAIEIVESGSAAVDLVLTDMMMPIMNGAELSAYLEEHHPQIPIIAASGLSSGGDTTSVGMGIARFIGKPYTTMALLASVGDTLREFRLSGEGDE